MLGVAIWLLDVDKSNFYDVFGALFWKCYIFKIYEHVLAKLITTVIFILELYYLLEQ